MKFTAMVAAPIAAILLLSGCAAVTEHRIHVPYDPAQAREALRPGDNTIEGRALIMTRGGSYFSCSDGEVLLIPRTTYAYFRMTALYGNDFRGYATLPKLQFVPNPPAYMEHTRTARCDTRGHFRFDNLADGTYYVLTGINWRVNNERQGGSLMQRIEVQGRQTVTVLLVP